MGSCNSAWASEMATSMSIGWSDEAHRNVDWVPLKQRLVDLIMEKDNLQWIKLMSEP